MIISIKTVGIIGAGPAGIATAIRLKQHNIDVVLFEANKKNQITIGEHLAAEALHELKKLEIPDTILTQHSIPCLEIQNAWGSSTIHHNESIFNPFGDSYVLSRPNFDNALLQHCKEIGIEVQSGVRINGIKKTESGWNLVSKTKNFNVKFIIDASGRTSKFNFGQTKHEKLQLNSLIGITKHLTSSEVFSAQKSYVLVESTKNGWWYTTQIASGKMISTFMTDPRIISKYKNSQSDFWNEELAKTVHTKERLYPFTINSIIYTQSAHSQIAKQIQGTTWLKVGDAAQSFDPLSSAGIIKGLKMGISAADAIHKYISGDSESLIQYEEATKFQYEEYQQKRNEYYVKELRWNHAPFWYYRNLRVKEIQTFSISPISSYKIIDENIEEKIAFLSIQLPEINFNTLINSIQQLSLIKDAVALYLRKENQKQMNPWFLHALESLKIIGIVA
ncbi:MAG: NAD(P)/FAD-dependent oxidoreductase [Flavobacteriaceae bacterium]